MRHIVFTVVLSSIIMPIAGYQYQLFRPDSFAYLVIEGTLHFCRMAESSFWAIIRI